MYRSKNLRSEGKAKILAFKKLLSLSNREIARTSDRSHKVVNSFIKLGDLYMKKIKTKVETLEYLNEKKL